MDDYDFKSYLKKFICYSSVWFMLKTVMCVCILNMYITERPEKMRNFLPNISKPLP